MRLVEILLFLVPFLAFAAWRLLAPGPKAPLWMLYGLGGVTVALLLALILLWKIYATDRQQAYVPAEMQDGHIVPAHRGNPH